MAHTSMHPAWSRPDLLPPIERVASRFDTISLEELGAAALMDRVDTKFLVPAGKLAEILERLSPHYRLLEVNGRRLSRYSTRYFDTPDLALYHAHHSGRARRYKVRVRTYVDSETRFLEVKLKNNKGRTRKARVSLNQDRLDPMERLEREGILGVTEVMPVRELRESVVVDYTRLTLVGKDVAERITLDLMLTFSRRGELCSYPEVVVAEVKQEHRGHSRFLDAMREHSIREATSLSKYCVGIANLEPGAKKNRFKPALRLLERVGDASLPFMHLSPAL